MKYTEKTQSQRKNMELCLLIEGSDNMIYSVYSGKDGEVPVIFNLLVKKR